MEAFQFTRSEMGWVTRHENDTQKFHIRHPESKLSAFSSLQRLSPLGLWGDIRSWRTQVLQVILNSHLLLRSHRRILGLRLRGGSGGKAMRKTRHDLKASDEWWMRSRGLNSFMSPLRCNGRKECLGFEGSFDRIAICYSTLL